MWLDEKKWSKAERRAWKKPKRGKEISIESHVTEQHVSAGSVSSLSSFSLSFFPLGYKMYSQPIRMQQLCLGVYVYVCLCEYVVLSVTECLMEKRFWGILMFKALIVIATSLARQPKLRTRPEYTRFKTK